MGSSSPKQYEGMNTLNSLVDHEDGFHKGIYLISNVLRKLFQKGGNKRAKYLLDRGLVKFGVGDYVEVAHQAIGDS